MMTTMPKKPATEQGNDKRLVVYITQEMYDQLEAAARKEDRSVSNYTRILLTSILSNKEIDND
jgi:hypothetical protein